MDLNLRSRCVLTYLFFSYCSLQEEAETAAKSIELWLFEKRLKEVNPNLQRNFGKHYEKLVTNLPGRGGFLLITAIRLSNFVCSIFMALLASES